MTVGLWVTRLWAFVAVLACALGVADLRGAIADRDSARSAAASLAADLSQISTLKNAQETALASRPADDAVTGPMLDILNQVGLDSSTLLRQSTGAEQRLAGPGLDGFARRAVQISLAPMTLPQLGSFIDAWREQQPAWIISELRLIHASPDAQFSVNLTLVTTYSISADSPSMPAQRQTRGQESVR
jgi:hypothetical protein